MTLIDPLLGTAAAIAMTSGVTFVAQAAAWRLGRRSGTLIRWLAVLAVLLWLLTVLFHLLVAVGAFARLPALISIALLACITWLAAPAPDRRAPWLQRDRVFIRRVRRALRRSRYAPVVGLFLLCALPALLRTLILPPLGWDALTYHSVKSGMWVQHGSLTGMHGPGPWAYYRNMPGGAEALAAWAMLPMSSDAFVTLVEAAEWLAIGLATMVLARRIGVREPFASTAAGFVMAIPTVRLLLGSGYVELSLLLTLVAGLALGLAGTRGRPAFLVFAGAMLGVAAATKLPMLVVTAVPVLMLAGVAFHRGGNLRASGVAAVVAYAAAALPWLIVTTVETGSPLSPAPVQFGSLVLGQAPIEFAWYLDRPIVSGVGPELHVLRRLFAAPAEHTEALGLLMVVPLAAFVPALTGLLRRRTFAGVVLGAVAGSAVAVYLSPGFAVVRQYWTENSSRFLLPAAAVVVVVSVGWCRWRSWPARAFWVVLTSCMLWNLGTYALVGFSDHSRVAAAILAALLVAGAAAILFIQRLRRWPTQIALASALLLIAGAGLQIGRDRLRADLLASDFALHRFGMWNYWSGAVPLLDNPATPYRIAVTSGPWQNIDNWFVYPFMGRRLQNEVEYVPVAGDGRIRHFGPASANDELMRTASAWAWLMRLRQLGITHVISFRPASIELGWMETDEGSFERLAGAPGDWGVFRLR